jgi:hypothetical protein
MPDPVRLTVVANRGESDLICALLRVHGIPCFDRVADPHGESVTDFGAWREILVRPADLEAARELLAATPRAV